MKAYMRLPRRGEFENPFHSLMTELKLCISDDMFQELLNMFNSKDADILREKKRIRELIDEIHFLKEALKDSNSQMRLAISQMYSLKRELERTRSINNSLRNKLKGDAANG